MPISIGLLAASSSLTGMIAGAVVAALSIWSWTWRARRGDLTLRRSDFDRVALGSRCDPAWMTDDMRERVHKSLETSLAKREDARPPDDVARFGAKDVQEAVLAYGLLRISAIKHKAAAASADRLLASAFEELPSDGGPYRETIGNAVPELGAAISAAARAAAQAARVPRRKRWFHKPWVQAIGLAMLTPAALAGSLGIYKGIGPAREIGHKELSSIHPPTSRHVAVTCEAIRDLGWQVLEGDDVKEQITFCQIGQHLLPIVSAKGETPPATGKVDGELKYIPDNDYSNHHPWVDALHQDADIDRMSYEVYLKRDSSDRKLDVVLGGAFVLAVLAGWGFWIRGFVRRRREKAAA